MREDPTARRNRGDSPKGLIAVGGIGLVLVLLMAFWMLRPARPTSPPDPIAPEASLSERVAREQAEDAARQRAVRDDSQRAAPRPQP